MLKIVTNGTEDEVMPIRNAIKANGGYCCCAIIKTIDTKCPCKSFKECKQVGVCHCGLYQKIEVAESAE